eukprot:GHVL01024503.1.p1 GENE.GHVL01024503.1~~GHVL01024503.1.p1  ORF type:complete len:465 (-),score=90.38 GHVL01024503.1:20-1414(-)
MNKTNGYCGCLAMSNIVAHMVINGHRFEVSQASVAEVYSPESSINALVKIRGIPYSATKEDIRSFFASFLIAPDGITLCINDEGRPSGDCFVRFVNDGEADKALGKNRQYMGFRYIEVFRASQMEFDRVQSRRQQPRRDIQNSPVKYNYPPSNGYNPGTLRARGLPWSATTHDVAQFFTEHGYVVEDVVLGHTPEGRPSGDAWIQFPSESIAEQARGELNKKNLGNRYVELFMSCKADMMGSSHEMPQYEHMHHIQENHANCGPIRNMGGSGGSYSPYGQPSSSCMRMGMYDQQGYAASSVMAAMGGYQTLPVSQPVMTPGGNYQSMGMGGTMGVGAMAGMSGGMGGTGGGYGAMGGTGGGYGAMGGTGGGYPSEGVLRLRGLPYSASEQDIVNFFDGYAMAAILPSTAPVNGKPSGEAYVEFVNPQEAYRAFTERNRAMLGNRYIELFSARKSDMLAAAGRTA